MTGLAIAVLAALSIQRAVFNLGHIDYKNSNFFVFWLAGHMVDSGQNPYDASQWAAGHDAFGVTWRPNETFLYPLPLAFFLAPLGRLPLPEAYVVWQILAEAVIVFVVWRLLRIARDERYQRLFFPLAVLMLFLGPTYLTVQVGAMGALTLGAIMAAIIAWDAGFPFLAGLLLSLTVLKPSQGAAILVLAAFWLLARRDWKGIAGMAFGAAAIFAFGLVIDPRWIVEFRSSSATLLAETLGRQSNALSFAYLLCGSGAACTWILGGILCGAILLAGGVVLWRTRPAFKPWEAFNIILPLAFLASIYTWSYDQVLYVIPVVWIAVGLVERTGSYLATFVFMPLLVAVSVVLLYQQAVLNTDTASILTTLVVLGGCALLGFRSRFASGQAP
jgi:Glycosyltransferase family 87